MPEFYSLRFKDLPIYEQLQLEEALLRLDVRNIFLINEGSPESIIMGSSAKPEDWVDLEKLKSAPLPLIKRFSGGGTVFVDANTVFMTFIGASDLLNGPTYPEPIFRFTETFLKPLLPPNFKVKENDYVIGEHKFGGNAQYIRKGRWLHHTSFLWDFKAENMNYLPLPKKRPAYRNDRAHTDFLVPLKKYLPCKNSFIQACVERLHETHRVIELDPQEVLPLLDQPHRKSTQLIDLNR